jgi:hypothetical protein
MKRKDPIAMTHFRMPSAAELYAYERLARRERAKAQAALIGSAARWLGQSFVNVFTKPYAARPRGVRHA